jgi:hypothetical protein
MPVPVYKDLTGKVIAFSYYGLLKTGDNIEIPTEIGGGRDGTVITNNIIVNNTCTPRAVAGISDGCGNRTSLMLGRNKAGATMCGPFLISDDKNFGCVDTINGSCTIALQVDNGGACIKDALHVDGSVGTLTSTIKGNFCNIGDTCITDTLTVDGATCLKSTLTVDAATCLKSNLTVDGTTALGGSLTVGGDIRSCNDIIAFYASDERLKTDLNKIENSNSIINSLTGYTFNWDSTKIDREGSDIGIMAQDAQKVLPVIVKERDNGYLAVDYIKLIPVMIEEIKSLNNRIITLEEQLNN